MRQIKFRAWDNNTNSWASEEDMWINGKGVVNYVDIPLCKEDGDDIVIEFFAGLKDKNGKGNEICQGDILALHSGTKYLVYWDNEYGQWWGRPIKESKSSFARPLNELLDKFYMEIIGTVHTHPELLEK